MARKIKIDNAILKKRQYKKTKREERQTVCKILIVCEGAKTEPNYFKSFKGVARGHYVYEIFTDGGGINTEKVVRRAMQLKADAIKEEKPYDSVWAVFDKDSFPDDDFDNAIQMAESNEISCAWSNEAFELWYLLHFHNRTTAMDRSDYEKSISEAVNASDKYRKKAVYKYKKNDSQNHCIMNRYGDQSNAIRWAKAMKLNFEDHKHHTHNPCTTVCDLVLQLEGKDENFNEQVSLQI